MNYSVEHIRSICEHFRIDGFFQSVEPIKVGNVNQTFLVIFHMNTGEDQKFLLQKVNTYAFRKPEQLMHNVKGITEHMHRKDPACRMIHYELAEDGRPFIGDDVDFWRIYNYIPAVTYTSPENDEVIYQTGDAFGNFQMLLSDFDVDSLYETIPDFHNTPARIRNLINDASEDKVRRLASVQSEYNDIIALSEEASILQHLRDKGELPVRVTHNDTKLNNVLFDSITNKAISVIDLDTVMPGLVAYDFGDAIRFMANTEAEDSLNWQNARVDMHCFEVFAKGFLNRLGAFLTEKEIETLSYGPFVLTYECACRFLNDYINGDLYFNIDYPDHNIDRCRCQLQLAKDCLALQPTMQDIILRALGR